MGVIEGVNKSRSFITKIKTTMSNAENTIKQTLNQMYDKAIDHALEIVSDAYLAIESDVMFKGKYTNEIFLTMLNKIKSLKSVQPTDPPPIADGIIPIQGDIQ